MARPDLRRNDELRKLKITTGYVSHAEGSVLIELGKTRVLCNASVEDYVPGHVKGTGKGWVTAEYSMLPRATNTRNKRDITKLKLSPRSAEIQRLIARALRAVTDLGLLGERTITVDCDVIEADGSTRCASITGGFLALYLACKKLVDQGVIEKMPLTDQVAAVSTGIWDDEAILDLCYLEDSDAAVDFNIVMTGSGDMVELQATGEERPFTQKELAAMLSLGKKGNNKLIREQRKITGMLK